MASACALAIFSGKIIFLEMPSVCGRSGIAFSTGGVVEENGRCSAAFRESAALREHSSVIAGDATLPQWDGFSRWRETLAVASKGAL